jgi:hypothetical protein
MLHPKPICQAKNQGFALVIALSMMSFVLLLLLSMSLLVSVETANAHNSKLKLLAKENARLGMLVAIGNLQSNTGADQVATARANITGDANVAPAAKFWTGAWDTTDSTSAPVWLVSGKTPDPTMVPADNTINMYPAIGNEQAVRVALDNIDQNDRNSGKLAWWISDDGSKASIAAGRKALFDLISLGKQNERNFYEYQSPFGVSLASLFDGANIQINDLNLLSDLNRINSKSSATLISDSGGSALTDSGELREKSHDIAARSYGLLTNTLNGGLKRNLSDLTYRDDILANDELSKFLEVKGGALKVESRIPDASLIGKPLHSPRPLITEAVLYIGLFHTWSDAKLRVRYHMEAEFVNPYSLPLEFATDQDSRYNRGLIVYFENLPEIAVSDTTSRTVTPTIIEDLNNFSRYNASDSRRFINSWFELSIDGTPDVPVLLPGETYQVMEPNPGKQRRGLARDFGTVRWSGNANTRPEDDADIEIIATHPLDPVSLIVVPYDDPKPIKDRDPIYRIDNLEFDDFVIEKVFRGGANPFSRPTSSSYTEADYIIAYHFRIGSDETDLSSMEDLLTSVDLRDPILDAKDTYTNLEGVVQTKEVLLDPSYTDPSYTIQDPGNLFSQIDQVMDRTARSHNADYRPVSLYDMPDGDILSTGQLSSLHLYRRKPRSIGNTWGGDYNAAFDLYYFSPKIDDPDPSINKYTPINPWLVSSKETVLAANHADAANEFVVGSFNVNSTSEAAWEAILSAPVITPPALDETSAASQTTRERTFFRLPQYQSQENDFYVRDAGLKDADNFFGQGIRALDGDNGEDQVRAISRNIVRKLKERTTPFGSMREFVNSGIIQESIDEVGNDPSDAVTTINGDLMRYSNTYLTQADVLTKIAPFAQPRSDTFTIRAYGDVRNKITGALEGSALCEAVVQRVASKLDGSDVMTNALAGATSRQYKILSLRWIDENDS